MAAKKTAPPAPSAPPVQPGPPQGADPAVVIARPDGAAQSETDAGALKQMAEDNGAGPRQEPIHRQTEPTAEVETDDDGRPVPPPKPKKHGRVDDEEVEMLADQLLAAMEQQDVKVSADSYGRTYEFYTTNMNNQAVVMCVVKRDGLAQQMPVNASTLSIEAGRENAQNAIRALDGMLV